MDTLTKRQQDTLKVIKKFMAENGYPPTVREIAKILELSSPATIQAHLDMLEKKEYIRKKGHANRTIELLVDNEYDMKDDNMISIPLVGKVTAGNPIEAIENPYNFFPLPKEFIKKGKDICFKCQWRINDKCRNI